MKKRGIGVNQNSPVSYVIMIILLVGGLFIFYLFFSMNQYGIKDVPAALGKNLMIMGLGLIFVLVPSFALIMDLITNLLPPKERIVRLSHIGKSYESIYTTESGDTFLLLFQDERNRKYYYSTNNIINFEEQKNYRIRAKQVRIIDILGEV